MSRPSVPLLWHFPISHFNEKVRWALDYKGIQHVRRALGVSYLPRAWLAGRKANLPILFLNEKAISDSTHILEELERFKPEPALYPRRAGERGRAVELEEFFDEQLGDPVRAAIVGPSFRDHPFATIRMLSTGMSGGTTRAMRLMFPLFRAFYRRRHRINDKTIAEGRDNIFRALDRLRRELQPSGYLVGDHFGVADLTAAALLSPLVGPPELEYAPAEPLPRTFEKIREELAGDPMCRWVREIYRKHRGHSAEVRRG